MQKSKKDNIFKNSNANFTRIIQYLEKKPIFRNYTLSKTLKRTARTLYTNTYINKNPFGRLLILLYYLKYPYYVWEDNKAII